MDQELFQECQRKFQDDEAKSKSADEQREVNWKRLEAAAATRTNNYCSVVSDNMLGGQFGFGSSLGGEQRAVVGS